MEEHMQGTHGARGTPRWERLGRKAALAAMAARSLALGACLLAGVVQAQESAVPVELPEESVLQVVREVAAELRAGDGVALASRVDYAKRYDEQLQRGHGERAWAELDETDQVIERQLLARAWTGADAGWMRAAGLNAVTELEDPDAGLGPVPDRRILLAVLRNQVNGELRDVLVTLTSDLQLLDLTFGKAYFEGANPAGDAGLRPAADFARPARPVVLWPADLLEIEREDARILVSLLLAARIGPERDLAIERLHRAPRPAVAALLERLDQLDREESPDADAQALLAEALAHITGRSADLTAVAREGIAEATWRDANHRGVLAWLAWHERYGGNFVATPIENPIEPVVGERRPELPRIPLDRWEQKLLEGVAIREAVANGTALPEATAGGTGTAAPTASGPPPSLPGQPAEPAGATSPGGPTVKLPAASGAATPRDVLFPAAANLKFRFGAQEVIGREVESRLTPSLKEALNAWAEPATRLGLRVVMSGNPEALVLGITEDETLLAAAEWMDEAWKLLDPFVAPSQGRQPRAIVAVLFDEKAARTPAWSGLLDDLVARRLMFETAADELRSAPAGLMLRGAGVFLQPTYDVAGNAAAGDDEFRLRNEVLHKYTQCLVTGRCGQIPPTMLWGLGELVELHFTKSVYMFNTTGFVATGDHSDWARRAGQLLEKRRGKKHGATVASDAMTDAAAGLAEDAQLTTWAVLAYMADKQPATLRDLLLDLSALHATADPRGRATLYRGDADQTEALLAARFDSLKADELLDWLEQRR